MHLLGYGLAYVFAVVLVNLEHVQEDGAQLGDVHRPQRPAHPCVSLEDLGNLMMRRRVGIDSGESANAMKQKVRLLQSPEWYEVYIVCSLSLPLSNAARNLIGETFE